MERLELMNQIYDLVYNSTESFEEENIGSDLAYLLGSILHDSYVEVNEHNALLRILLRSDLWTFVKQYITLE